MSTPVSSDNRWSSGLLIATIVRLIVAMAAFGALIFIPAGTVNWLQGWLFIGVHLIYMLGMVYFLMRSGSDLARERSKVMTEDTKTWDRWLTPFLSVALLAGLVVAGLDHRLGWSPEFALPVQVGALGIMLLGYMLVGWSMLSNPFFSRDVRIQEDRGHHVTSSGPYAVVRHPGYAGFIPAFALMAIALGSYWALIGTLSGALLLVVRTALEDRTLHAELDGYTDYAQRVRYRLLPGVW